MTKDSCFRQMILQSAGKVIVFLIPFHVNGTSNLYSIWAMWLAEDFGVWFYIVNPTLKFFDRQNNNFKLFFFFNTLQSLICGLRVYWHYWKYL